MYMRLDVRHACKIHRASMQPRPEHSLSMLLPVYVGFQAYKAHLALGELGL